MLGISKVVLKIDTVKFISRSILLLLVDANDVWIHEKIAVMAEDWKDTVTMVWNSWKATEIYASFYKMYKQLGCSCKTSMMTTCPQSFSPLPQLKKKSNILQLYSTKLINYIRHSGSHMFAWLWKKMKTVKLNLPCSSFSIITKWSSSVKFHRFDTYVWSVIVIRTFIGGWRKVIM